MYGEHIPLVVCGNGRTPSRPIIRSKFLISTRKFVQGAPIRCEVGQRVVEFYSPPLFFEGSREDERPGSLLNWCVIIRGMVAELLWEGWGVGYRSLLLVWLVN